MKFDNYMDPRKTFGKAVTQEAEKNEDIVVLSADSGKSSGFGEFIEKYPDRYFECGNRESSEFPLDWPLQEKYLFFVQSHRL